MAHGVTSRTSEVIHAGLYDPTDSLKARLCVEGRELIYNRASRLGIPHRRVGKLVVAAEEAEVPALRALRDQALANRVNVSAVLSGREIAELEPNVCAVSGFLSPDTGIVDSRALAMSYLTEAEEHGAVLATGSTVVGLSRVSNGWHIDVEGSSGTHRLFSPVVINAAGLDSGRLAALAGLDIVSAGCVIRPCKGSYFSLARGHVSLSRLVYPLPTEAGLGIHATVDLGGGIRFGPDSQWEWEQGGEFIVDPGRAEDFATAVCRYLPGVRADLLHPAYAGVRPKLAGRGEGFRDFVVDSPSSLPGLVNAVGIESPGLTAAPAIANLIHRIIAGTNH